MKKKRIVFFMIVFLCFFITSAFARFSGKPSFRLEELYRFDIKTSKSNLVITRLNAALSYLGAGKKEAFKLIPYIEGQWNHKYDTWIRHKVGLEIGRDIFKWLYLGQGFHYADLDENDRDREIFRKDDTAEGLTRVKVSFPLPKMKNKLKGYIMNEFTYNLEENEGYRNDSIIGAVMPIGKNAEANLDWRHIDRIHYYDSDTVEVSLALLF